MAEGQVIEAKFEVVNVESKTDQRKDGKGTYTVFNIAVKTPEGIGGPAISTFSTTAGKVLEENKGKVLTFLIAEDREYRGQMTYKIEKLVSANGELLYEPGMDKGRGGGGGGGGGRQQPEWSYRTPEERAAERRSIEGQKSLDLSHETVDAAVKTFAALVQFSTDPSLVTPEGAVAFVRTTATAYAEDVEKVMKKYASALRAHVGEKSGPGHRSDRSGREEEAATGSASGAPVARPSGPSSAPSQDVVPQPGPDSSPPPVSEQKKQILAQLDELLGGRAQVIARVEARWNKRTATLAELEAILAEVAEEALT